MCQEYFTWTEQLEASGGRPGVLDLPAESPEDRLLDQIMLGLRTADGLDMRSLSAAYGVDVANKVVGALQAREGDGLVQFRRGGNGEVTWARLTDPRGFLLSNDIISDVFTAFP